MKVTLKELITLLQGRKAPLINIITNNFIAHIVWDYIKFNLRLNTDLKETLIRNTYLSADDQINATFQILTQDDLLLLAAQYFRLLQEHKTLIFFTESDIYSFFPGLKLTIDESDTELINFTLTNHYNLSRAKKAEILNTLRGLSLSQIRDALAMGNITAEIKMKFSNLKWEKAIPKIAGLRKIKEWANLLQYVVQNLSDAVTFGVRLPKAVLLVGVPGTGKSMFTKYLAYKLGMPLASVMASQLVSSLYGETTRNLQKILDEATKLAPLILRFDEIEKMLAVGQGSRFSGHEETFRTLSVLLTLMEEGLQNVIIIGTSNYPFSLSPELLNRFDKIWGFDLPTVEERKEIISLLLSERNQIISEKDLDQISQITQGFSGRELRQIVDEAILYSFVNKTNVADQIRAIVKIKTPLEQRKKEEIIAIRDWVAMYAEKAN